MDLSRNNCFSTQKAMNNIPRTEKRKKLPVFEIIESGFLSSYMLPILSWKLKIIVYRGRPTIPTSSKLELFVNT